MMYDRAMAKYTDKLKRLSNYDASGTEYNVRYEVGKFSGDPLCSAYFGEHTLSQST
jgi:hypothetical protein